MTLCCAFIFYSASVLRGELRGSEAGEGGGAVRVPARGHRVGTRLPLLRLPQHPGTRGRHLLHLHPWPSAEPPANHASTNHRVPASHTRGRVRVNGYRQHVTGSESGRDARATGSREIKPKMRAQARPVIQSTTQKR